MKSKSLEKKPSDKHQEKKMDNIIEKNKITNNSFITSKSYNNLEEKDIKKEKKEEAKRTWKFSVKNQDNIIVDNVNNKKEEKKFINI